MTHQKLYRICDGLKRTSCIHFQKLPKVIAQDAVLVLQLHNYFFCHSSVLLYLTQPTSTVLSNSDIDLHIKYFESTSTYCNQKKQARVKQ